MKHISIYLYLLIMILSSCGNGVDKSLISHREKLISPNGQFTLYRYFVESPMSFGSGFVAITIINSKTKCDYSNRDILRLDNDSPFSIKWKDENTLSVKCLKNGELKKIESPKKVIRKWKNWTFEIEYFSLASTTVEIKYSFENYFMNEDYIIFKTDKDSLRFKKSEVQFSLDTDDIHVIQFKVDSLTNKTEAGITFSNYDLKPKGNFNPNDFINQQAFVVSKP